MTCSRAGTCCHGNLVRLNPWELAQLAFAKQMSIEDFIKAHTIAGGSILHFNGKPNHTGKLSCGLYEDGIGCSIHHARPLACRLFPIGRQIQNGTSQYIFQGSSFPCLKECPEVADLPNLSVEDYLVGQETSNFEHAQDEYMEVMQNVADIAFSLLLDTGLSESGDTKTLTSWRKFGNSSVDSLVQQIGSEWMKIVMIPDLAECIKDPIHFTQNHNEIIHESVQKLIDQSTTLDEVRETAELMMAIALFFAHSLGADAKGLSEHWIDIAKSHGASE